MKSYKNLWDKFISDENIELAIKNAKKSIRSYFMDDLSKLSLPELLDLLRKLTEEIEIRVMENEGV